MSMALIQRRVGADAVEKPAAFDVNDPGALARRDDDGQRRVIARAVGFGLRYEAVAAAHNVYLPGAPLVRARICSPNRLSTSSTASSAVRLRSSKAGFSSMMSSEPMSPESWIISMQS